MNIDQIARELAEKVYDTYDDYVAFRGTGFDFNVKHIKSALQAVRDEALEEAMLACNHAWTKAGNRLPNHADCQAEIRALKERKEP